jgi:hypothetical protein
MYNGNDVWEIPENTSLILQGQKTDNKAVNETVTYKGNVITADCTEQMTASPGMNKYSIQVTDADGKTLQTEDFILLVKKGTIDVPADFSETELDAFNTYSQSLAKQAAGIAENVKKSEDAIAQA